MKLKQACTIHGDYGLNISADKYVTEGVPLIRTSDFDDKGILSLEKTKFVPPELAIDKMLSRGDILFSRAGTVGRCTVFDIHEPASYAAYLVRFRPKRHILEPRFIHWWAQSLPYWAQIKSETIESTIGNFNAGKLGALTLPELNLETQKAIAAFLDRETARIDRLIEKKERFRALINSKRKALVAGLVDGSLIHSDTAKAHSGWFGHLPTHWKVKRARFLFRERIDPSQDGSEELLTVSHISGVTSRAEKDVNMFLAETLEGYKLVQRNDLVVNTMWAWMGAIGVSPIDGCASPSYAVYRPKKSIFLSDYLDLVVRSSPFVAEVNRRSKGIWASRLRLYPDAFLDIPFPVPPIDEQADLVATLADRMEREETIAVKSEKTIALLKEKRAALITAAVTGQIDVREQPPAIAAKPDRRLDAVQDVM